MVDDARTLTDEPHEIDGYRVVRLLGRGGMGRVHEVEDPDVPGRRLALKQLLPRGLTAKGVERFEREARALAKVHHRGVVRIHAVGRTADGPYLVEELVAGRPLSELVKAPTPCDVGLAVEVVANLADAVAALHAAQVLHRDLKPGNVMLGPSGIPVLLDFGLARELDAESLTQTGDLLGSPGYMAPEQAEGYARGALTAATDVYGLGAVLYALLCGGPPFEGTPVNVLYQILEQEPVWPAERREDVPPALDAVVRRALAKRPAQRQRDAASFAAELRASLVAPLELPRRSLAAMAVALGALLLAGVAAAVGVAAVGQADPAPAPTPVRGGAQVEPAAAASLWRLADGDRLTAHFGYQERTHHNTLGLSGTLAVAVVASRTTHRRWRCTITSLRASLRAFEEGGKPAAFRVVFDSANPDAPSLLRVLRHAVGGRFEVDLDPRSGEFTNAVGFAAIRARVMQEPLPTIPMAGGTSIRWSLGAVLSREFFSGGLNALGAVTRPGWAREGEGFRRRPDGLLELLWPSATLDWGQILPQLKTRTCEGGKARFADGLLAESTIGQAGTGKGYLLDARWTIRFERAD